MKQAIFTLLIVSASLSAKAQWITNSSFDAVNNNSSGKVGIGGKPTMKLDIGNFINGPIINQVVLRLRNTVSQNQPSGWGSAIEFYNLSNNVDIQPALNEGGAKIISEASDFGWAHSLKFRVVKNNNYSNQIPIDAISIANEGNVNLSQNLWVNNGATISSDFPDSDPNYSWNNNLMVRNNNNSINTFSRLSFVSQSGGYGAISLLKTGDYTGDMYFQVRNGAGFYNTPMLIKSNGNIGIGTPDPFSKLEVLGKTSVGLRQNGTSSDFEALSVFNTPASNLPSGNSAVIQFYNSSSNYNGVYGASIKSVSVNNQYGWESDLILRTTKNNSYSSQSILDALTIKGGSGNVGVGITDPGSFKLAVNGKTWTTEVQVAVNRPPDYVFEPTYHLSPLDSIKTYIDKNKHLPEVPSAKEMEKNGVNLGEMNMLLLKKIEELTLYVIEQNKTIQKQNERLQNLEELNRKTK